MQNLIEIDTIEQFNENNKNGLVVIDFWAKWCNPCRTMLPIIDDLAKNNPDITFLKVDVDVLPEAAQIYRVRSIPFFTFLLNGESKENLVGQRTAIEMQNTIDSIK